MAEVDRAVRHWEQLQEEERGVGDYLARYDRRALRASRTYDGMVVIEAVLAAEEGEELLRLLEGGKAGDGGSREPQPTAQRRADALVELVRAGQSAAPTQGSDRYTLHLVADVDALADRFGTRAELLDGTPLATETLRRLACDCGVVRHLLRGRGQPLDVGTRTPVWTAAQWRAISLREGAGAGSWAASGAPATSTTSATTKTAGPPRPTTASCSAPATTPRCTREGSASPANPTAPSPSTALTAESSHPRRPDRRRRAASARSGAGPRIRDGAHDDDQHFR